MSLIKQLYQLQEIDLEIEANEQALDKAVSQLGENQAIAAMRKRLEQESQSLEESKQQQHSLEWEIEGLTGKLSTVEEELYSGRIRNPKELSNLQQEADELKTRRAQFEDRALEVMGQVEMATGTLATIEEELKKLEADWQGQQKELSAEAEELKMVLSELGNKRQQTAAGIDPQAISIYEDVKKRRGKAVARVEQGVCHGCRISLSVNELQQVRGGKLVRCSSCGRILFLA